ncbi:MULTISPECIES: hypothetical protein [unclassified Shewanella]|uniref:hypothetical protein n=1 Tax=unclassified Shewanella TaxID=196818 RepID=UPI000D647236|nr:hypothetical protein [Shewanella sp. BC20]PWF63053.1 hypothetical protein CBX96_12745 [Shewanella sp. BC20]
MNDIWKLLVDHYQWVFSGAGIAVLGGMIAFFKKKKSSGITQTQKSGANSLNIQAGKNVEFTQKND